MTLDEYFAGYDDSRRLFEVVHEAVESVGPAQMRVTKSQVAFRHRRAFAWTWTARKYLKGDYPPLVLNISLRHRDPSTRWKQVVEPYPGRFTHHLEVRSPADIDDEVKAWLREAVQWSVSPERPRRAASSQSFNLSRGGWPGQSWECMVIV